MTLASAKSAPILVVFLIFAPIAAHAQGSPFDTGFTAIQSLFTGTIAKVASLVAIVIGGYPKPRSGSIRLSLMSSSRMVIAKVI
jgi:type IV secretory pathway VirB2 component (pilin)